MANNKKIDEELKAMLQRIAGRTETCPKCGKKTLIVMDYEERCTECKYFLCWHPDLLKSVMAGKIVFPTLNNFR